MFYSRDRGPFSDVNLVYSLEVATSRAFMEKNQKKSRENWENGVAVRGPVTATKNQKAVMAVCRRQTAKVQFASDIWIPKTTAWVGECFALLESRGKPRQVAQPRAKQKLWK